jgi:hypothetical protein
MVLYFGGSCENFRDALFLLSNKMHITHEMLHMLSGGAHPGTWEAEITGQEHQLPSPLP